VKKFRDADAMLNSGRIWRLFLQSLEVSESTLKRWRKQYGGTKSEEAVRLKKLEDEHQRLKQLVADLSLNNQMQKHVAEGNCYAESFNSRFRDEFLALKEFASVAAAWQLTTA